MGDLTWLANLSPGQLVALMVGLIALGVLVPRWVVRREQKISAEWREAYFSEVDRGDRAVEIAREQMDLARQQSEQLDRVLATLEGRSVATGRHHQAVP